MKCANCSADAIYTVQDPGVSPVDYCHDCLPESLQVRADAGQLALRTASPAPKAKADKADADSKD